MNTANWFDFDGRTVVVTGGAGGIGREVVAAFGSHGAHVVVADVDGDAAAAVAGSIPTAESVALDVTDASAVDAFATSVVERRGGIDVLVNPPAITLRRTALELGVDEFDEIMNVNVRGTWLPCQAVGRHMIDAGDGRIINYGSNAGIRGSALQLAYNASKAAVISITKSLAVEWAKTGVTVNAVAPGPTKTALMTSAFSDPATIQSFADRIPQGRLTETDVTVGPVLFLASPMASSITGHTLFADGGMSAT
jgi:NAD(P)-dependent dehydrogenase (short-subunit alcohol dehydrogenase family)